MTQVKRSEGKSVVAAAAYRAGENLFSEYYGEYNDYTYKGGVRHSEIMLPDFVPEEYHDRQTLWNAVEKVEKHPAAQLAYSFDIALQNELTEEENLSLAREFLQKYFVERGMIVDFAMHDPDREEGIPNPHFHFLCPTLFIPFGRLAPELGRKLINETIIVDIKTSVPILSIQPFEQDGFEYAVKVKTMNVANHDDLQRKVGYQIKKYNACRQCLKCESLCKYGAINIINGEYRIDEKKCKRCKMCITAKYLEGGCLSGFRECGFGCAFQQGTDRRHHQLFGGKNTGTEGQEF